jgi:ABC-type transporter Mla maintaining outer membrane lipid asymmetry ATPase subunit MlaF
MAGLVTALSVREASPKTNILILDEPGHGLDPLAAKRFAQGLLQLQRRFPTILVTTHNPMIESVLSGNTVWTVVKSKRISRLVEGELT